MSDRVVLFLFSVAMLVVSLGASAWLLVSGQAGTVDGLFFLLTCLLVALCFALYLMFIINRAKQSLQAPPQPAKASAQPQKGTAKATTSPSQPVETS